MACKEVAHAAQEHLDLLDTGVDRLSLNTSSWQGRPYTVSHRAPDGLADPCHMAAISLMNISVTLINNQSGGPGAEGLADMRTLMRLSGDVGERALEAHRRVEDERTRIPDDGDPSEH